MLKKRRFLVSILKQSIRGGIAAALAIVIVSIASKHITKIGSTVHDQRVSATVLEKRQETSAALRESFRVVGNNDQKILNALPPVDNILDFVAALESIASANSLQQTSKFGSPVSLAGQVPLPVSSIDFDLTVNGNVATLTNYLQSFERLQYFAGITGITITSQTPLGWEGDSTIAIRGKLYSRDISTP